MENRGRSWRCTLCSYVHLGEDPPGSCPLCGAPASDFEEVAQGSGTTPSAAPVSEQWRCILCGYIHLGAEPPQSCPLCGADRTDFEAQGCAPGQAQTGDGEAVRVVVIGAGIAGVSAAEAVRENAPGAEITLICGEDAVPYYRLNLTRLLAGEINRATLPIHPEGWYEDQRIDLLRGERAERIDREARRVVLGSGRHVEYDRLILAMGSHAFVPPMEGVRLGGVFTLRTVDDVHAVQEAISGSPACVVIGGGVLGLECAGALAQSGCDVTLLESHDWLMPRQINRQAGEMLEAHLDKLGIRLLKQARTREIVGNGKAREIQLQDGRAIPAQLVILATGIRPDTYLARKADLEVNRGVVVNNHLQTSDPAIYAAGDVAEHNGILYGIWGPSQIQGRMAGLHASGGEAVFSGVPRTNSLKVLGVHLSSVGKIMPDDGSEIWIERREGDRYAGFLFSDGKLMGGILLGDTSAAAGLRQAVETGRDFAVVVRGAPDAASVVAMLSDGSGS